MKKERFLYVVIIILLAINAFTILTLLRGPHPEGRRPQPKQIISDKLGFDAKQVAAYEKLIQSHRQSITNLDNQINELKNDLYQRINTTGDEKTKAAILSQIANKQAQIETIHFQHLTAIYNLCNTKEQQANFDELKSEFTMIFQRLPHKKP